MSSVVKIEYNYNTLDRIVIQNMGNQTEFDKFIADIKERSILWADMLIKEAHSKRFEEAKREAEQKQKEALEKLRKGVCNLELCYANGKQSKCSNNGYLGIHPTKGFRCFHWNHKYPCTRVTPTGRISVNRTRYEVLDRFKLIFFKKAIVEEIAKVRQSYQTIADEAKKKIEDAQNTPTPVADVLGAMNGSSSNM